MKKLLLLFLSVIALTGCSKDDDSKSTSDYEVVSYSYEAENHDTGGYIMRYTATIKNNTNEDVSGVVRFTVPRGGGQTAFEYLEISANANDTGSATGLGSVIFDEQTITISDVDFISDDLN